MRASRIGSKDKNSLQKPLTVPKSYLHGCKQNICLSLLQHHQAHHLQNSTHQTYTYSNKPHIPMPFPQSVHPLQHQDFPLHPYPSTQYQRTPNTPQHHHPPLPSFPNHHPCPPNSQLTLKPHPPPFSLSPSPPVPQFPNSPTPTSTPTSTPT